ncbi:hypothetical protein G7Y89_g2308 [Cudoniella acicularis]|uniref:Uncharacterized protein n=1 Tax=Cudoniella acicularis TaxID=354080 RepID=A0A8H4RUD8_9HELO|nr:hypothetical protein G7Y89_g2308 [Cudoniella acicularis]
MFLFRFAPGQQCAAQRALSTQYSQPKRWGSKVTKPFWAESITIIGIKEAITQNLDSAGYAAFQVQTCNGRPLNYSLSIIVGRRRHRPDAHAAPQEKSLEVLESPRRKTQRAKLP